MRMKMVGNKKDIELLVVRNGDTVKVPKGTPVILSIGTTLDTDNDGLKVVLPNTAGAAASNSLMYGIATKDLAVNDYGEVIAMGYAAYAVFTRATRAATTDSWTSSASIAQFGALAIDTVNNAFALFTASAASSHYSPYAVIVDSVASMAASASATSDTRTVQTTAQRVFCKML